MNNLYARISLIILLVLSCSKKVQSECTEYNLLETNSRLKKMPVANQGSFNTCYAHSLSGVYETKTGVQLHPYSIAYEHKKRLLHWKPYDLDYSLALYAWYDVKKKGVCSGQEISKRLDPFRVNSNYNDDQVIYALKAFFPEKDARIAISKLLDDPFQDGEAWKGKDLRSLYAKLKNAPQEKFFEFLDERILKDCAKVYPELDLVSDGFDFQTNHELAENYLSRLEKGQPSVIGYCSKHMKEEDYMPIKPRAVMAVLPGCGAHYTMVVGQKKIGKSCQVLIRNSHNDHFWGRDNQTCVCKGSKGISRLCSKADYDPQKDSVTACYYDREKLLSETFDISFLR